MSEIKTNALKNYLQCPKCGEYHEFEEVIPSKNVVCLFCDEIFGTENFKPFAITYKKPEV